MAVIRVCPSTIDVVAGISETKFIDMYRRSKFLEVLLEIRQEMAREADYDVDFFAEIENCG